MNRRPKLESNSKLIENNISANYNVSIAYSDNFTSKTKLINCVQGNCYLVKKTNPEIEAKFNYLSTLGIDNVLYPEVNVENKYVSAYDNEYYYLTPFYKTLNIVPERKAVDFFDELINVHLKTQFPRQLSPKNSRYKFDELTRQLDYKFKTLEEFIRSLESGKIYEIEYEILKRYYRILDAKSELFRLQKKIVLSVKDHESVNYVFVHNNPKLEHLLYIKGNKYIVSVDKGKIGIESLDFAKFYVENEYLNVDFQKIIIKTLQSYDTDFYYDYFRFLVLLIYIKRINISSDLSMILKEFDQAFNSIDRYFYNFIDKTIENSDDTE